MLVDFEHVRDYRRWLVKVLQERKQKNPCYSLRALSMSLGISPASLCQIISGKRPLTQKMAKKIASRLSLPQDPEESQKDSTSNNPEMGPTAQLGEDLASDWGLVKEDVYKTISEWYHYAIICLAEIATHSASPQWVAMRLNIREEEAEAAIRRLCRLQLIKVQDGKLFAVKKSLSIGKTAPEQAVINYHKENLKKASEALDTQERKNLEFSAITMAINPDHLPKAKELIAHFRRDLCQLLESGEQRRIYTLSVQLFALDQPSSPSVPKTV